ncbi:hypothetical protein NDU88_004220 [Pleurodeles waltl]|uniref:Uncharacterized protein n=1 Tax=Pleurodeles waltl TaxID=8319 RepID=A0AAV7TR88_PLEWA|nr:hypothetical protein NDU88_004220 [Pleurodeles waltl]
MQRVPGRVPNCCGAGAEVPAAVCVVTVASAAKRFAAANVTVARPAGQRIDLVYCNTEALLSVTSAEYFWHVLSDHSPLQVEIRWSRAPPSIPTWRIPVTALHYAAYRETLRGHIDSYFKLNANTASDVGIEWDAFKVVLRGHVVKTNYGAALLLRLELWDLESELQHYEQLLPTDAGAASSLVTTRIAHQQALDKLAWLHYRDYQARKHAEGDKVGKLLAWLLRQSAPKHQSLRCGVGMTNL